MVLQTVDAPEVPEQSWLDALVRVASATVPFYRDHLAGANTSTLSAVSSFDKRMTAGYGQFPISVGGPTGAHRVMATSGTTGARLYVAFGRDDWERVGDWLQQVGHSVGLTS